MVPAGPDRPALGVVEEQRLLQVHQAEALPRGGVLAVGRTGGAIIAGVEPAHAVRAVDQGRPDEGGRGVVLPGVGPGTDGHARCGGAVGRRAGAVAVIEVLADQGRKPGQQRT